MRIFGWMADLAGCGHYRMALPLHQLSKLGHEVRYDTVLPPDVRDGEVDVIVGQRVCQPGPTGRWQGMARRARAKMVFEVDDDLWHIEPSNKVSHEYYHFDRRRHLIDNITVADVVTVTSEPLADLVSQWNPNVVVLPNCVPEWMLSHHRPMRERLTIGWAGSHTHSRDFGEVARSLRRVLQEPANRDRVEFHCIGPDYTQRVASPRASTRHTGWVDSVESYLRLLDFDIGLAPLRPSTFNDAKSDLKLLELAALGIPAIVSDTGPYARAVATGCPARVATGPRDWVRELTDLVSDTYGRAQQGIAARDWARKRTIEANAHRWVEAYQ